MNDQKKALHIDIPVKLAEVKVAFSVAALGRSKGICPRPSFTFTSSSTISPTGRLNPKWWQSFTPMQAT